MSRPRLSAPLLLVAIAAIATPASAQWGGGGYGGGWGGGGWGRPGWGGSSWGGGYGNQRLNTSNARDSREGKVDADVFMADGAADLLGQGPAIVTAAPGGTTDASDEAVYEAAIVDQLVKVGYDTEAPDPKVGQVVELRIMRDVLVPPEDKRNPVSGEAAVSTGTYGSSVGLAVAVDLTKPRTALLSTRMEVRVRDRATDKPLWEGRAEIATRDGDDHWGEQAIATRLAAAIFEHFPATSRAKVASR